MYERIKRLGAGHFGEVWLELDRALNRLCAAKYLNGPGSASLIDPFGEARTMLRAEHEHVVSVYGAELEGGIPVIRMEYLAAGSVADVHHGEPLPVLEASTIIEDACRGLESLHAADLLHRDLKPANLMIAEGGKVKVSDFGLACEHDQASTAPIGYIPHLPPEALPSPGYIDSKVGDVYAMGVTLYRLLNGDQPLMSTSGLDFNGLCDLVKEGKWPPRDAFAPYVHERLRRVVRKALNTDSGKRYNSSAELRHAIESARPIVSWRPSPALDGAWDGEATDGSTTWLAYFASIKGERCFRLERALAGKSLRLVTSASGGPFLHPVDELQHAANVLQQVAVTGRSPGSLR